MESKLTTRKITEGLKPYRNAPAIGKHVGRAIARLNALEAESCSNIARVADLEEQINNMRGRSIGALQSRVAEVNRAKGFGMAPDADVFQILAHLQLVCCELAEAAEDVRKGRMGMTIRPAGKPEGFPTELADAVIRILNIADDLGIDLETVIDFKTAHNATRTHRHGGKLA